MSRLDQLAWPMASLPDAIAAVARRAGLQPSTTGTSEGYDRVGSSEAAMTRWVEAVGRDAGLEAEPVAIPYHDLPLLVRSAGPAIVRLPSGDGSRSTQFIVLLRSYGDGALALAPNLSVRRVSVAKLCARLKTDIEAPVIAESEQLFAEAGVPRRRRRRALNMILRERLSYHTLRVGWILRLSPGASFYAQLRQMRVPRRMLAFVGVHALQYAIYIVSWAVLGWAVLSDRVEPGWLLAWALLLLSVVPLRMLEQRSQSLLSIDIGALLKQRMLYGALKLEPEEIKHQGIGQLLGSVLESEAVEHLALTGTLVDFVGIIELVVAAVVLGAGAAGILHGVLLIGWAVLAGYLGWRYYLQRRAWTDARLAMTHDMVEQMVGHRTRLAQQPPSDLHDAEDRVLPHYLEMSKRMDNSAALITTWVARGWLFVGLLGLAPAFVAGPDEPALLAVSLGGILLAYRALARLGAGLVNIAGAAVAWERSSKLFSAAARNELHGQGALIPTARAQGAAVSRPPVVEADRIVFRYRDRGEPILQDCSLHIRSGERLLLEGPSGGGKSTLVSLLTGLRSPESGLLLLHGLDRRTVGQEAWRRRVVAAPQFHDNYVFSETFGFNLLMGRGWPPEPEDFEEAEAICRELGLESLLARMPSGLMQMVGETGWQLSHGERSRLFMARALLQNADVVILDESFGALDPETLQLAMQCALRRANTLLLVAHP